MGERTMMIKNDWGGIIHNKLVPQRTHQFTLTNVSNYPPTTLFSYSGKPKFYS